MRPAGVKQVAPAAAILTSNMGDIAVETLNHLTTAGQYTVRQYQYETGDRFRSVRFQPQGRGSSCLQTLYLEADEGEIRYFSEGEWHHQPLQTGLYRAGMYFLTAGDQSVIVSLPRCYQDRANDCIEAIPGQRWFHDCDQGGHRLFGAADGTACTGGELFYLLFAGGAAPL